MRFKVPISKRLDESIPDYVSRCMSWLPDFKRCLRNCIVTDKLECRKISLFQQPCIHWVINNPNYNIRNIIELFINSLQCLYDNHDGYCYYAVPKKLRCPYTVVPLDTVIRILEYGTDTMVPLYWIRPSYRHFTKTISSDNNKRIY